VKKLHLLIETEDTLHGSFLYVFQLVYAVKRLN